MDKRAGNLEYLGVKRGLHNDIYIGEQEHRGEKDVDGKLWALIMRMHRLVIAMLASWYTWASLADMHNWNVVTNFAYLTQIANAAVAAYYLAWCIIAYLRVGRGTHEFSAEIRGFVVLLAAMVGLLFNTLLGPSETHLSTIAHTIVPILVLVDWLLFGGNQHRIRRWVPLVWLVAVLAYLGYYVWYSGHSPRPYPFLNPAAPDFLEWVGLLALAFLTGAYLVYFIGKLVSRIRRRVSLRR